VKFLSLPEEQDGFYNEVKTFCHDSREPKHVLLTKLEEILKLQLGLIVLLNRDLREPVFKKQEIISLFKDKQLQMLVVLRIPRS
jgi:hypothetical protein